MVSTCSIVRGNQALLKSLRDSAQGGTASFLGPIVFTHCEAAHRPRRFAPLSLPGKIQESCHAHIFHGPHLSLCSSDRGVGPEPCFNISDEIKQPKCRLRSRYGQMTTGVGAAEAAAHEIRARNESKKRQG